jgi:hypothetical protein
VETQTLTLKAFANSSPGLALKPWGQWVRLFGRYSEGVATVLRSGMTTLLFQSYVVPGTALRQPRVAKRNPGLELANAFSVRVLV